MTDSARPCAVRLLLLAVLAAVILSACAQDGPLPTLAPAAATLSADELPATRSPEATLPPPPIITVPSGATGSTAISVPTGNTSSQVVVQMGATGSALPDEVQRLLDDLDSGALMLNSSPAGQGGEPVKYAYRDMNGDGARDLVVIVVAEPVAQSPAAPAGDQPEESVQAIGINLDELLASISQDPDAPLIRSAFVYSLSQEELEQLDRQ